MDAEPASPFTDLELLDGIWELYTPSIKDKVQSRSAAIAKHDNRSKVIAADVFTALQEYMPGHIIEKETEKKSWLTDNVSGFMVIVAVMAVFYGLLGVLPWTKSTDFIEIAKIFAGALVGGAAGAAVTTAAKR